MWGMDELHHVRLGVLPRQGMDQVKVCCCKSLYLERMTTYCGIESFAGGSSNNSFVEWQENSWGVDGKVQCNVSGGGTDDDSPPRSTSIRQEWINYWGRAVHWMWQVVCHRGKAGPHRLTTYTRRLGCMLEDQGSHCLR